MAQVTDYTVSNQTFPNTRADINNIFAAIATNNSGTSAPSNQQAGQWWIDTTSSTWVLYIHDGTDDIQFATIDTSANTVNFTDSALDVVTDTTPQLGGNLDLNSNDITGTGNINITGNITASGNLAGTLTTASQPNITSVGTLTSATVSGDLTVDTDTLYVDSSTNSVGIGITSPLEVLHIKTASSGVTTAIGGVDGAIIESGSGRTGGLLFFTPNDRAGKILWSDPDAHSQGALSYDHSSDSMTFNTNGSERMRIDSSGNVLVGYTSTEQNEIFGVSAGASNDGAYFKIADAGDTYSPIVINRRFADGKMIEFFRHTSFAGSIGVASSARLTIGKNDTGLRFHDTSNFISPWNLSTNGSADNSIDLGGASDRFKDAYLSGNIYLGGTGSANALDDYEEGTFTPVVSSGSGTITSTSSESGTYVKIGKMVTVCVTAIITNNGTGATNVKYTLPFTNSSGFNFQASARENNITGIQLQASINNGTTEITFRKSDNTYPGGTNYQLQTTISYFTD